MLAEDLTASVRGACRATLTRVRLGRDAVSMLLFREVVQACEERVDGQLVFVQ